MEDTPGPNCSHHAAVVLQYCCLFTVALVMAGRQNHEVELEGHAFSPFHMGVCVTWRELYVLLSIICPLAQKCLILRKFGFSV